MRALNIPHADQRLGLTPRCWSTRFSDSSSLDWVRVLLRLGRGLLGSVGIASCPWLFFSRRHLRWVQLSTSCADASDFCTWLLFWSRPLSPAFCWRARAFRCRDRGLNSV